MCPSVFIIFLIEFFLKISFRYERTLGTRMSLSVLDEVPYTLTGHQLSPVHKIFTACIMYILYLLLSKQVSVSSGEEMTFILDDTAFAPRLLQFNVLCTNLQIQLTSQRNLRFIV